jgi:LPXTG-motif cell wall-anchored protein
MTAGGATNELFVAFGVGFGVAVALTGAVARRRRAH